MLPEGEEPFLKIEKPRRQYWKFKIFGASVGIAARIFSQYQAQAPGWIGADSGIGEVVGCQPEKQDDCNQKGGFRRGLRVFYKTQELTRLSGRTDDQLAD